MEDKATPRPWDCVGAMITRANDLAPVALTGPYIPHDAWPDRGRDEAEANAELVVRAVNQHDALQVVREQHDAKARAANFKACGCDYCAALALAEKQ